MLERLVEYWLDSVNERSYQPAFVQILVSEGHRVLHSTRHAPIEFGKDVVTIGPNGVPCAFQLKGNPGSRLTHAQFRQMHDQIQELVCQAIAHPAAPRIPHRSFLVTNGLIEEEVQRAIGDLNRSWEAQGRGPNALEVIDRGEFLNRANALGPAIWPFDIRNLNAFIELLAHNGRDELPADKVTTMLSAMFELDAVEPLAGAAALDRRTTSTAILIAVSLRNFEIHKNHWAIIATWVIYVTHALAACERAGGDISETVQDSIAAARQAILASLSDLCDEVMAKPHLIEGAGIPDAAFYHPRILLLAALASVYWLWCEREGLPRSNIPQLEVYLSQRLTERCLWGEAAVPQILAHSWYIGKRNPGHAEQILAIVLSNIIRSQLSVGRLKPLASPYFPVSTVIPWSLGLDLGNDDRDIRSADFGHTSYCAEGLMSLVARAGLKERCKADWPRFTMLDHQSFEVEDPWQFCLLRSGRGVNRSVIPEPTTQWADLQAAAADIATPKVPTALRNDPVLLFLLTIIAPFRATPDVVRYLGWCFSDAWALPQPRPTA